MTIARLLATAALLVAAAPTPPDQAPALAPGDIVAAAPAADWVAIAPSDLLVMTLAPDVKGRPRQVIIQLMPPPFSQGWIGNIRKLAAAHWWDGTSVNRVQDNYVVQWGDADAEDKAKAKPLPSGLVRLAEKDYSASVDAVARASPAFATPGQLMDPDFLQQFLARKQPADVAGETALAGSRTTRAPNGWHERDSYADWVEVHDGWPIAIEGEYPDGRVWPIHCYGMVGVGRNLSPDTGSGAELYTVIGQAPRHLDRNIALVGRVIEGIEHLSSLPRGTEALGFYKSAEERTAIVSIRPASELPAAERPRFEYLSTESVSFARYADARANRRDAFFIRPAGGADICNVPVPVRRVKQ